MFEDSTRKFDLVVFVIFLKPAAGFKQLLENSAGSQHFVGASGWLPARKKFKPLLLENINKLPTICWSLRLAPSTQEVQTAEQATCSCIDFGMGLALNPKSF